MGRSDPSSYSAPATMLGADVNSSFLAGSTLPLVLTPASPGFAADMSALVAWLGEIKGTFEQVLATYGAVLLRGFPIHTTADFASLVESYPSPPLGYAGGATSREAIAGRVYEATRSPAEIRLMLHQEMAYLPRWPKKLAFYCHKAPLSGGETIIADVRAFDRRVPPRFHDALRERGVRYVRNFRAPGPIPPELESSHRTWQEAFYTDDPKKAEADCAAMALEWEWLADGSLSAAYSAPGFVTHPLTGDRLWFNHVQSQTMTPHSIGPIWAAYDAHYRDGRPKPYDVRFGDGGAIDLEDVMALFPLLDEQTVAFPWQPGDVLFIDNILTFHGRNPFKGERDVQVALMEESSQ